MKYLSVGTNAKTIKSDSGGEYLTAILYLAPWKLSGHNVCPAATKGCISACLNTAGRGQMMSVQNARIRKTLAFINNRHAFLRDLEDDIRKFIKRCEKEGVKPAVRLNGTSDIRWEMFGIMEKFPTVQFYDYTKIKNRKNLPKNYHLTYSKTEEDTIVDTCLVLNKGRNVAVVFDALPKSYAGYPVINGDAHDLRFIDPPSVIVGLTAKGKAKKDTSGFTVITKE